MITSGTVAHYTTFILIMNFARSNIVSTRMFELVVLSVFVWRLQLLFKSAIYKIVTQIIFRHSEEIHMLDVFFPRRA